jgi:tetratricopeptide (TPR) repeat protein
LHGVKQDYETTVIENSLYGAGTAAVRYATAASILLTNWKLMVWPSPLSWDYSFDSFPLKDFSDPVVWLSVCVYLMALIASFYLIRRKPLVSWGLFFFLLLLLPTSNLFFLNGTTYAERFLFLPSAGLITALVAATLKGPKMSVTWKVIFSALVLAAWTSTLSRCDDWKDNLSLFASGAMNAPNSSRTQMAYATELMNRAEKSAVQQERMDLVLRSKEHFERALEIFPDNANAAYRLGLINAITGDTTRAIALYRRALASKPEDVFSLVNLGTIYFARSGQDSALYCFQRAFAVDSLNDMTLTNLMVVHFNRGEDSAVVRYGEIAVRNGRTSQKVSDLLARSRSRMALQPPGR